MFKYRTQSHPIGNNCKPSWNCFIPTVPYEWTPMNNSETSAELQKLKGSTKLKKRVDEKTFKKWSLQTPWSLPIWWSRKHVQTRSNSNPYRIPMYIKLQLLLLLTKFWTANNQYRTVMTKRSSKGWKYNRMHFRKLPYWHPPWTKNRF